MLKLFGRFLLILGLIVGSAVHAEENFLLLDAYTGKSVLEVGDGLDERVSPCSSFKIALSLMGFDTGKLIDEEHPLWPYKEGYPDFLTEWKKDQTPRTWIKHSCVWYSKFLAEQIGQIGMQEYLRAFDYGNQYR